MESRMLIKGLAFNVLVIFNVIAALENNSINLSIINDSNNTVLITFVRSAQSVPLAKLLEAGEAIDFGRVYEASVQSYSTLWGYVAPAKRILFSACFPRPENQVDAVAIRVKGITGRSFFNPFGQWDCELLSGKNAVDTVSKYCPASSSENVLEVFPTAKRKIMYTARYILGLPQYAGIGDALEAAAMLEGKWRAQCVDVSAPHYKLALNVIKIIYDSRAAFQHGQADVPLHIPVEMRSAMSQAIDSEETEVSWS